MEQRFQTFLTRLRTHRIAVLVDITDPDWQRACLAIIGWFSQIWGGANCIIIPTDGNTITDQFWAILSAFDADFIYYYQKTLADLKISDPTAYQSKLDDYIAAMTKDGHPLSESDKQELEKKVLVTFNGKLNLSASLIKQLRLRLSPYPVGNAIHINLITRNHDATYPFTRVEDIVEFVGAGDYIFNVINDYPSEQPRPPSLWQLAECRFVTASYQKRLEAKGVSTVLKSIMNDTQYDLIEWGIKPEIAFQGNSPFDFSRLVQTEVQALTVDTYSLPSIVVIGETLADFCLYFALSKMHGRTIWLPNWFMPVADEFPKYMGSAIRKLEDKAQKSGNTSFALMSTSLSYPELHKLIASLRKQISTISFAVEDGNDVDFIERQISYPRKRYISQNVERVTTHQLVDDRFPGAFESPVPSAFTKVDPSIHRYVAEITFAGHQTPRHPSLNRKLVYGPRLGDTRAGNDGATYSCPGSFVTSTDIELQILRPGVYVPAAEEIFKIALEDCEYEHVISDKGAYEAQTLTKFGGLPEIAKVIGDDKQLDLLRKYRDTTKAKDQVYDEGTYIEKLERRFLNFAAIKKILGDIEVAKETIDQYVIKGIFYRGLYPSLPPMCGP